MVTYWLQMKIVGDENVVDFIIYAQILLVIAWGTHVSILKAKKKVTKKAVKEVLEEGLSESVKVEYVKAAFQKGVETERKNVEQAYAEGLKAGFELAQEVEDNG